MRQTGLCALTQYLRLINEYFHSKHPLLDCATNTPDLANFHDKKKKTKRYSTKKHACGILICLRNAVMWLRTEPVRRAPASSKVISSFPALLQAPLLFAWQFLKTYQRAVLPPPPCRRPRPGRAGPRRPLRVRTHLHLRLEILGQGVDGLNGLSQVEGN